MEASLLLEDSRAAEQGLFASQANVKALEKKKEKAYKKYAPMRPYATLRWPDG